jgi:hypothetical protein
MKRKNRNLPNSKYTSHSGQSMLEVAVALPFLLLIIIALIEMGIVFASYLSLVNAAREGAVFASMYPTLADLTCGSTPNPGCVGPKDSQAFGSGTTLWDEYVKRVNDEIVVVIGEPLKAGQLLDQDILTVQRPILGPTSTSCPTRSEAGCPITITVHYRLHTFTSDISLPAPRVRSTVPPGATFTDWVFNVLGNVDWSTGWRMGLPNYYQIDYSFGMPIR